MYKMRVFHAARTSSENPTGDTDNKIFLEFSYS